MNALLTRAKALNAIVESAALEARDLDKAIRASVNTVEAGSLRAEAEAAASALMWLTHDLHRASRQAQSAMSSLECVVEESAPAMKVAA